MADLSPQAFQDHGVKKFSVSALPQPFLKWAGGKHQLLPEIQKFIPGQYSQYYEP
ncbi:MAG: hypothetical protein AAFQ80_17950 [Cyanobacteria bacterium J06621_8]